MTAITLTIKFPVEFNIAIGSQSDAGAKTREILMTILHTLKKRSGNVESAFKSALDKIAADPNADRYATLFK